MKFREILKGTLFEASINLLTDDAENNLLRDLGKNDFIHSKNVEDYLDRLVPNEIKRDEKIFDKAEIFLLLYAVYLHDIGRSEDGDHHEAETYNKISANPEKYGLKDKYVADAVAEICYGHAKESERPIKLIDDNYGVSELSNNRPLNLRFLAALLRLADELDNAYPRVRGVKGQEGSARNLIRFVDINDVLWLIEFQCVPKCPEDLIELDNIKTYSQKRLDEIKDILKSKGLLYHLIRLDRKTTSKIETRRSDDIDYGSGKKPTPYDDSLFEVATLNAFYELTKNVNFLEKPLQEGEWKSKRKVVNFDKRWIETARGGLATHQILLITGPPNIGKSTFLLFFLNECLEHGINDWDVVIFLNPFIKEEELDHVLEEIQSNYGENNILLAIDGLRREEDDKNYLKKSIKLFEKAYQHNYRLIVTLRDSEKEFLKRDLKNLSKWGWHIDQWKKFEPNIEEIVLTHNRGELGKILVNYLDYYDDKIGLQGISFDEMNRFYKGEEIPLEKKKQYQAFEGCMGTVVDKSEELAGYIAFLVEDMAKHKSVFSDETVKKYPRGMTNLILNTISKDFYVEGNYIQNDEVIPLLVMLLTRLEYPMTEHFFDSIMAWGFRTLDTTLKTEDKEKITDKINNWDQYQFGALGI